MPDIRVMNWNIQKLSGKKVLIPGIATAIGQIIHDATPDIVLITEVSGSSGAMAMEAIANAARTASVADGGAATDYTGWLLSHPTGGEQYGIIIRDLTIVRPITVATGPTGEGGADDDDLAFLGNLDKNTFSTWPADFTTLNPYPVPPPHARPFLPLTELYAQSAPRGRTRKYFSGQKLGRGGFALGLGFRMPCLAMFSIRGAAQTYLLPIIICHLGAVRGGANYLAQRQVQQYKNIHISQMYTNGAAQVNHGYIWLDGQAQQAANIMFTGDFNIDFLLNNRAGHNIERGNNRALICLTPTAPDGGSATPAALPGPFGAVLGAQVLMPVDGWPKGPIDNDDNFPNMSLRTAITVLGTMLHHYEPTVAPTDTIALRGACFDNFFYGGTDLSHFTQILADPDAAEIVDVPLGIAPGTGPTALDPYDVSGAWMHNIKRKPPKNNAAAALSLAPVSLAPLTPNDRLIGARFISDHLPSVIQFNLP